MSVRKRRKKNRMRGNRTHGGGNTKNRRGRGTRGGAGRAGSHKHKFSKYHATFGVKKRLKQNAVTRRKSVRPKTITTRQLEHALPKWLKSKRIAQEGGAYVVDAKKCGFSKLIAGGNVTQKMVIKNCAATQKTVELIKAAGGSIESATPKNGATPEAAPVQEGK